MAEEKKTIVEKLHAISTPANENWLEIANKWEEEDKVLEELIKYFQGLWPGMETAEQCNTDMHFTPPAIMRLARHFAVWGAEHASGKEQKVDLEVRKQIEELANDWHHKGFASDEDCPLCIQDLMDILWHFYELGKNAK